MKFITGEIYDPSSHRIKRRSYTNHTKPKSKFYLVWDGMKQRCLNKNHKRYDDYGGRGIGISEEWIEFINFLRDMEPEYSKAQEAYPGESLQLDRIDNDMGYCRSNCRWVPATINMLNQRARSNSTFGKGIRKTPSHKFQARVQIKGSGINIGTFDTAEEAQQAREAYLSSTFPSSF
jgi:hypothetical protein